MVESGYNISYSEKKKTNQGVSFQKILFGTSHKNA